MMIDSAYSQIGKALKLPTHAYMGLSDSKCVDTQAGLESGIGAILAALSGINVVSGGGMMDFESTQSLEKLVIDNDICGMAFRLLRGVAQREEPIALHIFKDLDANTEFLTHTHTLQWFPQEQIYSDIIDRGNYQQWASDGKPTLTERAHKKVEELLSTHLESHLNRDIRKELKKIILLYGNNLGLKSIPFAKK
jgi:trimethylamine--corrinoid protein Co-methyltransferase